MNVSLIVTYFLFTSNDTHFTLGEPTSIIHVIMLLNFSSINVNSYLPWFLPKLIITEMLTKSFNYLPHIEIKKKNYWKNTAPEGSGQPC